MNYSRQSSEEVSTSAGLERPDADANQFVEQKFLESFEEKFTVEKSAIGDRSIWLVESSAQNNIYGEETAGEEEVSSGAFKKYAGKVARFAGEITRPTKGKVAALAIFGALVDSSYAHAQLAKIGSQNVPLPDPTVIKSPNNPNTLIAEGTSDYGQKNFLSDGTFGQSPAAIPILESKDDGLHWKFENYVFPNGQHPLQAEAPLGNWPGPRYWAPELHFIEGKWVNYFATTNHEGQMAIFVAWTDRDGLFKGHWHSRELRYRGQFNDVPGNTKETTGGLIDPTVAKDKKTGQLLLSYTVQPNQTFIEQLSPNGLYAYKHVCRISYADLPWEDGVQEGTVLRWDSKDGVMTETFNAGSTWGTDGHDYKVGFMASANPLNGPWVKYARGPIIASQPHLREYDPGMGAIVTLPDGKSYVFYHILRQEADHNSQDRILARSIYNPTSSNKLYLPDGVSDPVFTHDKHIFYYDQKNKKFMSAEEYSRKKQESIAQDSAVKAQKQYIQISVPSIGMS